jgi:hypothetical protein
MALMAIRPDYYKGESGHDIFWDMETGKYPMEWAIGFCEINADKYERRLGKKTKDTTLDKEKAQTYREEAQKLRSILEDMRNPDDPDIIANYWNER